MSADPGADADPGEASAAPSRPADGRDSSEPGATYRLQLHADFGFGEAAQCVDYLSDLGVTHLYLSPIMRARSGSTHGYDVVDPTTVSPELGGEDGLRALATAAAASGLGLVADIVPNHMAASDENTWWDDMLAEGVSGGSGSMFDVDWRPPLPTAEGKVILPVLGDSYGAVLAAGGIELVRGQGTYRVRYGDSTFPLRPATLDHIDDAGGGAAFAGTPDVAGSWEPLHRLLEEQHYRLVHWRIGDDVINYRRFFTIDDLAAVRTEVPEVFDRIHATIIDLVADGVIHGLRVDHPDGLRDPERYFQQLRNRTGVWIVAEKILHPGEHLPSSWSVAGTTGYDFCVDVLGLAVDPDGLGPLAEIDERLGGGRSYGEHAVEAKTEMLRAGLSADLERLALRLWAVTQQRPQVRDVTLDWCRRVLERTLAHFDVYRTYVDPETGTAADTDRERVTAAVDRARAGDSEVPEPLWDFLAQLLAGEAGASPAFLEVTARFQQLCSAVTAKGTEDTAFYRYRPLLAANEVGADPADPVRTSEQFQQANAWRAERAPLTMLTTATHDTKRGEDTRLRMAAISEVPEAWRAAVDACEEKADRATLPAQSRQLVYQTVVGLWPVDGDPHEGHRDRLAAYVVKAEREAGLYTTWTDPDSAFEERLAEFARQMLDADAVPEALRTVIGRTSEIAMVAGLGQVVLRCLSPGVPDCYQGTELWDDSLVDPDNRRPVAVSARAELFDRLIDVPASQLLADRRDGRIKAFVLRHALRTRAAHPACFGTGSGYLPLDASGEHAVHVVAFARVAPDGSDAVLVVVPRLPGALMDAEEPTPPLADVWGDTSLRIPGFVQGEYTDVFSDGAGELGDTFEVAEALATLPVAVLART